MFRAWMNGDLDKPTVGFGMALFAVFYEIVFVNGRFFIIWFIYVMQ